MIRSAYDVNFLRDGGSKGRLLVYSKEVCLRRQAFLLKDI